MTDSYQMTTEWKAVVLPYNTEKMKEAVQPFLADHRTYRVNTAAMFGSTAVQLVPRQGGNSINLHGGYVLAWDMSGHFSLFELEEFKSKFAPYRDPDTIIDAKEANFYVHVAEEDVPERFMLEVQEDSENEWTFNLEESDAILLRDALVSRFPLSQDHTGNPALRQVAEMDVQYDRIAQRIINALRDVVPGITGDSHVHESPLGTTVIDDDDLCNATDPSYPGQTCIAKYLHEGDHEFDPIQARN